MKEEFYKMEYIFGKNTVAAFLDANQVLEIYIEIGLKDQSIQKLDLQKNIPVIEKKKDFLDRLTDNARHQGMVAKIKDFTYASYQNTLKDIDLAQNPTLLMLDGIEDPHNLGAIIRTVEAFQVDAILLKKHHQAPINATVAKVSTGALANVKIIQVTNLTQTLIDLKKKGFWIVSAEAYQGVDYHTIDYHMPLVLVVGSEGFGISQLVKKQSDFNVYIPMVGKVNSLNVSVATAILLAHIQNQKRQ